MSGTWRAPMMAAVLLLGLTIAYDAIVSGNQTPQWGGVFHEHPAIQYATRPTTDRVARLQEALTRGAQSLQRDPKTGYLRSILTALGLSVESQLLVFSKTGVQRAYT